MPEAKRLVGDVIADPRRVATMRAGMTDKAKKATRKALQRWEGEGGATAEGPQQPRDKERPRDAAQSRMNKVGRKHRLFQQGGKLDRDAPSEKLPGKSPSKDCRTHRGEK